MTNDEEILDERPESAEPIWPDERSSDEQFDDPYAEDFVWEKPISRDNTTPEPLTEPTSFPATKPASPLVPVFYMPETTEDTVRRGGLAYSAGIVFFVSVAFSLLVGWIADWLFGSRPWGLVGGIVLGSIIGFVQFFRITSRIFRNDKNGPEMRPLLKRDEDE